MIKTKRKISFFMPYRLEIPIAKTWTEFENILSSFNKPNWHFDVNKALDDGYVEGKVLGNRFQLAKRKGMLTNAKFGLYPILFGRYSINNGVSKLILVIRPFMSAIVISIFLQSVILWVIFRSYRLGYFGTTIAFSIFFLFQIVRRILFYRKFRDYSALIGILTK
jgi:hypothetical protein